MSASEQDPGLFDGITAVVEKRLVDLLCLRSEARFPMRRLITLWNNTSWSQMATRWCRMAIGKDTFNVTTWESMMRCRFDDVRARYLSAGGPGS